ncbi:MAG: cell envelope biogenesis protein OmpA [Rhodobacteraceae bacterium]|nr:MAG: cell envelope biogenesis protein OmpA [Paracoccaceae bacterium]
MFRNRRAALLAALFFALAGAEAVAQDVTLSSRDGGVEISGTLLGFDGEFYRVDTIYGELTIDGSGVTCEGPGCPSLTDFVAEVDFSGSSTIGEVLMPALLEGFALRNGYSVTREDIDETRFAYLLSNGETGRLEGHFVFRVTTTDEGFADLLADEADVVMALREIRPEERQRAEEAGMGDMTGPNRSRVLALDAMVPIVAAGNPVKSISTLQLAQAFAGQITNWQDLGGPDAPIALHLPDGGSGLAQAAEDLLLSPAGLTLSPQVIRHRITSDLPRSVVTDPFALGLASFAEIGSARMLTLTGSCGFSLAATRRGIKTEDYPLTSPMFLYLPARRLPMLAREFLAYTRGPAAQIVIRRAGFVDQAPEAIPVDQQGDRLANAISVAGPEITLDEVQRMIGSLRKKERLTTSFRFETGSSRLDAQSRSNVEQLARAIEAGVYDARTITFVGFSDGEGPAVANLEIARRRAEAVRTAVQEAAETVTPDRVTLEVAAYGEAMPMACDDTEWGRQVNRRVEVWLR